MQTKTIRFQRIEVENLSLKDGGNLKVFYSDGKDRMLTYPCKFLTPEDDASKILLQVKNAVKSQNSSVLSDNPLDCFVNILIEDDDGAEEKISNFIRGVKEKIHRVKYSRMASGYLDALNSLKGQKMQF
ncbi:hypothetical protein HZB03_03280 [Candidatus Woesearchaeota archaeon]|nr:hypothetical protein [Candidatus Woesearchaeota archaeon]